jgi:Zn-dependent peptidase ImmA (M78 family)
LREYNITKAPVDIRTIIQSRYTVLKSDLVEEGLIYNRIGLNKPVFVINNSLDMIQKQTVYAHELAHVVLGHLDLFDLNNLTDKQHSYLESEAFIFSNRLLLPTKLFMDFFEDPVTFQRIREASATFQVPRENIIMRLLMLNMISIEEIFDIFPRSYFIRSNNFRKFYDEMIGCKQHIFPQAKKFINKVTLLTKEEANKRNWYYEDCDIRSSVYRRTSC